MPLKTTSNVWRVFRQNQDKQLTTLFEGFALFAQSRFSSLFFAQFSMLWLISMSKSAKKQNNKQ
jgi:hypothetical protein